jgi:alpha-mannosidase
MYAMKIAVGFVLLLCGSVSTLGADEWTIYVTNDNCPDYTWGLTEEQTRQAFADIVRAHLDEMNRTDNLEPANCDRYNMAVTQEALCFVERYSERQAELIRRIKEGRIFVSPFLCNSLWAFHSTECALRVLYPARRLERDWGIPMNVAEHIEEPSLPWGMASILAGAGVRWLSVPFYNYDSTFKQLQNPPLFLWEGPDGSRLQVIMDPWASSKALYAQGAAILKKPESIEGQWLPHYAGLGEAYPLRAILASGTHGDIAPRSGAQARGFTDAIIKYNAGAGPHPKLINATLPQFCEVVDRLQAERPFLPTVRGGFGHSWDLWPVSLAKSVADMRQGERDYLAAEALLAVAACSRPEVRDASRKDRERAEWCWAMLSDHAWNGTDMKNKRHNAELRHEWNEELARLAAKLTEQGWATAGLARDSQTISVFNSLSFPRKGLVRLAVPPEIRGEGVPPLRLEAILASSSGDATFSARRPILCQVVREGQARVLYFVAAEVPAFSFRQFQVGADDHSPAPPRQDAAGTGGLSASTTGLESPFYRLSIDPRTGGVASLVHKASGRELWVAGSSGLCQTVFFDGKEHALENIKAEAIAEGPVLARMKVTGTVEGINVTNFVTVYAELDQVDFDLHVYKPVTTKEQRLCHVFPVLQEGAELRIETPGAVIRPRPQPQGDLLPGADTRRFAVQGFIDASTPEGVGVTIAPLDIFALRLDLVPITFEALGNDQNYREVTQDQDGVTDFRFRYVLCGHAGGYRNAETIPWSRSVATPLLSVFGSVPKERRSRPVIGLDPSRAIATCLKPADGDSAGGFILRWWETAGKPDPIGIDLPGYKQAFQTDLLERDQRHLPIADGRIEAKINPNGLSSIRLLP